MTNTKILPIIEGINALEKEDKQQFINWLKANPIIDDKQNLIDVLSVRKQLLSEKGLQCPHCNSLTIIGFGRYRDQPRYRCKSCLKTFNALSGTAIDKIKKKDKWEDFIRCMMDKKSLRYTAKSVGICLKTAFDWRHKILSALKEVNCQRLEGIVEADETFFLYSEKGNKKLDRIPRKRGGKATKDGMNKEHINVIAAADRSGRKILNVGNRGVITKKAIEQAIGQYINKDKSIFCSDSHITYQGYALENKMPHKKLYARKKQFVIEGIYHTQNVNNLHGRLKKYLSGFNGVASKYLQNYVNYFRIFTSLAETQNLFSAILNENNAYYKNKQHYAIT